MKYNEYLQLEEKPENSVIGYFWQDDIFELPESTTIFVAIDEPFSDGFITAYCPVGQHSALSVDYLVNDCIEIKKATYIKFSDGLYTPEEYLK